MPPQTESVETKDKKALKEMSQMTFKGMTFFFFLSFLGLHPWHMEVSRLGVELELQLLAYTTAKQHGILATSATYTTAHGNAGSLTH